MFRSSAFNEFVGCVCLFFKWAVIRERVILSCKAWLQWSQTTAKQPLMLWFGFIELIILVLLVK